jgi:predicted AAA+ superfamily ATPase
MPHHRKRLIETRIFKSLAHSPIVGILGQRQTGKTTLLESLVSPDDYVTLDKPVFLNSARSNPESFIDRDSKRFGIDECQLAPELFPALKERVRTNKRPGQFVLTGSVRYTSRKLIRESLTGRIVNHELLPLCMAELYDLEMTSLVELVRKPLATVQNFTKRRLKEISQSRVEEFLLKGGLPGICFFRKPEVREERFLAHLDTLLQRDLKLVFETTLPVEKLWKTLRYLAKTQGKPLSFSEASRESQISSPALQRLIPAFEALFLIRRVASIGDRKKDRFFLEDQGMASFLYREQEPERDQVRFLFSQLLAQVKYLHGGLASIQSFETRSGVHVPLVIETNGEKTALVPLASEAPDLKATAAAESFLRRYPKSRVALLTTGRDVALLNSQTWILPYRSVI